MASFTVTINEGKLRKAVQDADGLPPLLDEAVSKIAANANAMSAGFRTGIFHDHATGETRGDTQPRYAANVEKHGSSQVGLVYTANYSAMKDNHLHNTLLKSI